MRALVVVVIGGLAGIVGILGLGLGGFVPASVSHGQPAPVNQQLTPAQVLAKVEATYAKAQHLTATFEQTVYNATFGATKTSAGTVYLARPDKMRWDYKSNRRTAGPGKSFIADGKILWIVEPENLQVIKKSLANEHALPAAVSFLNGSGKLAADFHVGAPKSPKDLVPGATVLELTPKQPNAQYTKLRLVVDPSTWQVVRSVVVSSDDNTNTFVFASADLTTKPAAALFVFDPASVRNYKIVDVKP